MVPCDVTSGVKKTKQNKTLFGFKNQKLFFDNETEAVMPQLMKYNWLAYWIFLYKEYVYLYSNVLKICLMKP